LVGVTSHDDAAGRIVTQQPGNIGNRDTDRFQRTRRLIDEEPGDLAAVHTHQPIDDGGDMPGWHVRRAWRYGVEALPDERAQVAAQQGGKCGLLIHLGPILSDPARNIGARLSLVSAFAGSVAASARLAT